MKALDLVKIFFRSFFIQAAWNYERMQNIGFLYGIMPALKKIYPDKNQRFEVVKSHLEFFNTHPYMIGILMGMTVSLEEKTAKDEKASTSRNMIQVSKTNMAGPLAAIGDAFFWAVWRPFCALLVVFPVVIFFKGINNFVIWWLFFGFLIFYNSLNIYLRYYGVFMGYRLRERIIKNISRWNIQRIISTVRIAGFITVCIAAILYFIIDLSSMREKALAVLVFCAGTYLYRKGVSSTKLFYGLLFTVILVCLARI
ncbi:MAG: PTS system mannose/fructose/sorbose family transporter subunit IID [Elusimicrobia bacterium]|nr:PTS system mannose/fructose/sorbose family transporter subunit IID [Elusimicrobiota bacterium]MBU2615270.1 PTS system mannose/fructose/sorbose family transporter subunit IID [Elusimicrobiota bacterium]